MTRAGTAAPAARRVAAVTVAAAAAAGAIRLALAYRSFDVFGDEFIYSQLGRSVMAGGWPGTQQGLFFLHPPGFFYLEAGWGRLLPRPAGVVGSVYQMRTLNVVLAAATAAVLVLLGTRAGALWAGGAAGLLFAVDPFCIRQNDRVLLETAMMFWVLLGYLAAGSLTGRPVTRGSIARAAGTGLLFGCAVLTKDQAALLTVLPVAAAWALGWGPPRRLSLLAAAVPVAVYGVYVAAVALGGHAAIFWTAKTGGVRRLLGLAQITGFNSPNAPSIFGRLATEAAGFWPTYLVLALALPACVLLLWRGGAMLRLLGLLEVSALVALAYGLVLGTLEEQMLYLLIVPSLLTVPLAAWWWQAFGSSPASRRADAVTASGAAAGGQRRRVLVALAAGALAVTAAAGLATAVRLLATPDTAFVQVRGYMVRHVPAGAGVASVDDLPPDEPTTTYWLLTPRYRVGRWVTPAQRRRQHVRYVIVPWGEVDQHYSYLTPAQVRDLVRPGRLLFAARDRSYGLVALYELPWPPRSVR